MLPCPRTHVCVRSRAMRTRTSSPGQPGGRRTEYACRAWRRKLWRVKAATPPSPQAESVMPSGSGSASGRPHAVQEVEPEVANGSGHEDGPHGQAQEAVDVVGEPAATHGSPWRRGAGQAGGAGWG